jgi:hypothetical protein
MKFLVFFVFLFLIIPVHADLLYWQNITPHNDPFELKVNPGDTLYMGRGYDLSYVYGTSKKFAWWKDWSTEDLNCNPDKIVDISYISNNGKLDPRLVFIDSGKGFIPGNWYQWDGCFERYDYSTHTITMVPYLADDNLAFRVVYPPYRPPVTIKEPTPTFDIHGLEKENAALKAFAESNLSVNVTMNQSAELQNDREVPIWYYFIAAFLVFVVFRIIW